MSASKWIMGRNGAWTLLFVGNAFFLYLICMITPNEDNEEYFTSIYENRYKTQQSFATSEKLHHRGNVSQNRAYQLAFQWKNNSDSMINSNKSSSRLKRHTFMHSKTFALSYFDPCSVLKPPKSFESSDKKFHSVNTGLNETFVFSAYFDYRREDAPCVRIIGLSSGKDPSKFCQVWYTRDDMVYVYPAMYTIVPETHGHRYAPSIHVCELEKHIAPYAVSLVNRKCVKPTHTLKVLNAERVPKPSVNYTVCVSPLHFGFNNSKELTEMIELNTILGSGRFVFYNYSSGSSVSKYLNYYSSVGVADVIQWRLPVLVDTRHPKSDANSDIHYFGQLVALNDCLYRNMYKSKYVVFTDLDEFIIPRKSLTWDSMTQDISCPSNTNVYIFRCTFFRTDWDDSKITGSNDTIKRLQLNTLLKLNREKKIYPPLSRSKMMVRPTAVEQIGVHGVWEMNEGDNNNQCNVQPNEALLHHYRQWEDGTTVNTSDMRMLYYTDQLITSTYAIHRQIAEHA